MRVMLIDDHPLIVSAMQRILRELDLQTAVVTAGSAAAAREVLQADASFDLLLLDLALPDIDGHAFLGELRRTHPSLPVVVVSASERAADVVRAIDAGADAFVSGEISERTTHLAREAGVIYARAGHHATERYGVQALGARIAERFGIKVTFIDDPNPV